MTKASKRDATRTAATTKANENPSPRGAKPRETKRAQLIRMLKATKGSHIAQISKKLGWQRHATRAALTGLRKAGFTVERSMRDGGGAAVYRITAGPSAEQPV